jgi:endoglucanase
MVKALSVAAAAALLGVSVASCGMMGDRDSGSRSTGASSGSSSDCAGLTGSARERCLSQQSGRSSSGSGSSGAGSSTGSGASGGVSGGVGAGGSGGTSGTGAGSGGK